MILRPFRALRPEPKNAALVSAVPYDVVNRDEAATLAQGNPLSFLHVSRPEIDLDPKADPYGAPVYAQARKALDLLRRSAPLVREKTPMIYLYRLTQGSHTQTGIAATFSVDEYDRGAIARHEKTRRDKEDDRTRHLLALEAQTGPAFLAYRGLPEINDRVARITSAESPLFDFGAPDGVRHTIWAVAETVPFVAAFKKIPRLYIADGHHRSASASRAHAELSARAQAAQTARPTPGADGADLAHAFFLAVAFPAEELRILPYHRVVKDLRGLSTESFLGAVGERFEIHEPATTTPARGEFAMYLKSSGSPGPKGRWYGLRPKRPAQESAAASAIDSLDVSVLQDQLLSPVLGIQDPRTDSRIDFVGGIRGPSELESRVESGKAAVAFALHPTTLGDVIDVSDADGIMPPKSTWFEPKLRDGLLSHLIGQE